MCAIMNLCFMIIIKKARNTIDIALLDDYLDDSKTKQSNSSKLFFLIRNQKNTFGSYTRG